MENGCVVGIIAAAGSGADAAPIGHGPVQDRQLGGERRRTGAIEADRSRRPAPNQHQENSGWYLRVDQSQGRTSSGSTEVKVGDKVNARYYENVVVRLKQPGEPDVDSRAKGTTGSEQVLPGGTKAKQLTITATIAAIDTNAPSITFTGPNGWKYTSKVQDTEALAKVKVGDKVDIVWTEAMMVSLEPGSRFSGCSRGGPPSDRPG